MRAELKWLHSPDCDDLKSFEPSDPCDFALLVQAMIGPADGNAAESFDFTVCSTDWIRRRAACAPMVGLHHMLVAKYDYDKIEGTVRDFCAKCQGSTWQAVAAKLNGLGRWEFDDYRD